VIRNAVTRLMKEIGYGRGYRYAHDEPEGVGGMECLPESLVGRRYYRPLDAGEEAALAQRLEQILDRRRQKREAEKAKGS
jgi:putative ATPase